MDLLYQRHGVEEALERNWDADLQRVEECFTCESRDACRASCGFGIDIPNVLIGLYRQFYPVLSGARQSAE
jgi:hypothetical protein